MIYFLATKVQKIYAMTKNTTITSLRLSADAKEKLAASAKNQGKTESELLRSLIDSLPDLSPNSSFINPTDTTETHRLTLRLPKILLNAAIKKANKKGMTLTKWVESLIQVSITKSTVLSETEFFTLRESNKNLLAIGRNINQIARAFNASLQFSIERRLLDELAKVIKENSAAMHEFLKASHNVWGDD